MDIPGEDVQVLLDGEAAQKLGDTQEWEWFVEQVKLRLAAMTENLVNAPDWDTHQQNVGYQRALRDVITSLEPIIEEAQDAQEFYDL